MTRNEIKNTLLDLLYETKRTAQNEAFDKYVEFENNRGEFYAEEMLRMENGWKPGTDIPYDKEALFFEFFEKTGITSDYLKDFVDQEELYKYGELLDEQKEAIEQLLSQEEYKGITLSQIMTLKKIQTAKEQNWEEEDKYGETGVSINMIVDHVVAEENKSKEQNLYYEAYDEFCAPEIILKKLAEKLNVKSLKIDKHMISHIQTSLKLDQNLSIGDIRLQDEKKRNPKLSKYIDAVTAKITMLTADIGEIDEETLKILYDHNFQGKNLNAEKSKLYEEFCDKEKRKEEEIRAKLEQEFKSNESEKKEQSQIVEEQNQVKEEQPQEIEEQTEIKEEEPQEVEEQNQVKEEQPQEIEEQTEIKEEASQKVEEKTEIKDEQPQEVEEETEIKEEGPQVVEEKNQIIEEQNELIEKQQQTIEKQQQTIENQNQIIESQQQSQEKINELQEKIKELEKENSKQMMVIKALNKRTAFLENIINKQEACIHKIMNNFRAVKSSVTNALTEVKPKKFFEKIAARFSNKNDSKLIAQANIINNLEEEAEINVNETLTGENAKGSTKMFVKEQIKQMTSANKGREENQIEK